MQAIDLLQKLPLFAGLSGEELGMVAHCLGRRVFGRGVFIYHKDSPGHVLYLIESGLVRLFVISDSGQEVSLDVFGPGEVFGEVAVLDDLPRPSGAVAIEPTLVWTLQREDLLHLLERCPRLVRNLMELLTARLRYATRSIEQLAFLDVNSRVAARLLDLAARSATQRGGIEIELNLTQGELATWVAASRESVNKVLAVFRSKGLIAVDGSRITLLDRRRLEQEVRS